MWIKKSVLVWLGGGLLCLMPACATLKKGTKDVAAQEQLLNTRAVDALYHEGVEKLLNGKEAAAMDLFSQVVMRDSMHHAAHFQLGRVNILLGNAQGALQHLSTAYRQDPTNYWYGVGLLNVARAMKLYDVGVAVLQRQVEQFEDRPELYLELSELLQEAKRNEEALAALDKVEVYLGKSVEVSEARFRIYASLGDEAKSFEALDSLIAIGKKDIRYSLAAGDLCMEIQNYSKALEYYQSAYKQEPNNGQVLLSLANYYDTMNDADASILMVEKAIKLEGLDIDAKIDVLQKHLVLLLSKQKEIEDARALFDLLVEQHPQSEKLFQLYAAYLLEIKCPDEAREKLEVVVSLSPSTREPWVQLLQIELSERNYEGVIKVCARAREYHVDTNLFYLYAGIAYSELGKKAEAIKVYEAGIRVFEPTDPMATSELYGQLGDLHSQMNQVKQAKEVYEKALKYNPKNKGVMNNYAYFLAVREMDLERAEQLSGKTIEGDSSNPTYLDTYAWVFFKRGNYILAKLYIESAINNGASENGEVVEHYGDILYFCDEKKEALVQWKKALELGVTSDVLRQKISTGTYVK